MPLRLDIKRKLSARSDRVKCVDLHPSEPWMLASLYNGNVHIWNHESQQLIKSFEVCDLPVRASRFVARKNWVVTGSDDMHIRVYNYNTLERVHQFEAHSDYLRAIAVHPTQPYILTSSDDMLIKLWDWEKKWTCTQVFEGHTHYVMQIVINPKDNNTFASASLDRSVKVWQLGSTTPNFTLEGHEKGVNCVDYYTGGDKPYLISGADDRLVKIWDYQNKTCVQTLEGHAQNISAVAFHPELPIIMTGSEDGTVRIWHANTYRLESTLNYGLERVWTISCRRGSNNVALGYDEGSIMIKLGREEPAMSMDINGKIVWAKHAEIQQANIKALSDADVKDGERLGLAVKDMGSCEIYPQTIAHNPNGRFVVVCGDGEYIIYTAMALRNKSFGSAQEFVWSNDSSVYCIRESTSQLKIFKNFKELKSFKPDFGAEGIYGGSLLGVRSVSGLALYDWDSNELVRRIEITPKHVFWSESNELVCIATEESFFILKFSQDAVEAAKDNPEAITEDGIEEAFEVVGEIEESVRTGCWVGDCFIYTNGVNRLNYYVGGEIVTIAHLDRVMYLLGYIPKDNRLYLGDKELCVVSYSLLLSVLEYQTAVMRRDFDTADKVLPTIPREQRTRVAHFLEKQGFKSQAMAVTCDPEHKFELALQLGDLKVAYTLAKEAEAEQKWKQLADLATSKGEFGLAQECLHQAQDFGGLLLLASSAGNASMVLKLAATAQGAGQNNVSFLSYFSLGKLEECLELLVSTGRLPEAAFFARTYMPSQVSRVVSLWRESLGKVNQKAAQSLADPADYENLFTGLKEAYKTEEYLKKERKRRQPAINYQTVVPNSERNPIDEMLAAEDAGEFAFVPPEERPDLPDEDGEDEETIEQPPASLPPAPESPPKSPPPKSPPPESPPKSPQPPTELISDELIKDKDEEPSPNVIETAPAPISAPEEEISRLESAPVVDVELELTELVDPEPFSQPESVSTPDIPVEDLTASTSAPVTALEEDEAVDDPVSAPEAADPVSNPEAAPIIAPEAVPIIASEAAPISAPEEIKQTDNDDIVGFESEPAQVVEPVSVLEPLSAAQPDILQPQAAPPTSVAEETQPDITTPRKDSLLKFLEDDPLLEPSSDSPPEDTPILEPSMDNTSEVTPTSEPISEQKTSLSMEDLPILDPTQVSVPEEPAAVDLLGDVAASESADFAASWDDDWPESGDLIDTTPVLQDTTPSLIDTSPPTVEDLEKELELDLDNVKLDDNIDTSVLDGEDLDDWE